MTRRTEFPIDEVRAQFPALARTYRGKQVVYFDGPAGSQMVQSCIDAVAGYMMNGSANTGGRFPTSIQTEAMIQDAREAVADLFSARPSEVAFGANMTTLTMAISRALAREWDSEGELVVSEMDHRGNVDPWLAVAEDRGMTVRWLQVNPETLTLDLSDLESVVNSKTKLVAVGRASNAIGTINDVPKIAAIAKEVGALVAVDVVHAAPHVAIDRDALGADILGCSAYKFFGPHIGMAVIRADLFERLKTYKVEPAHDDIPGKLETGTQNHECIAGIRPAIEFIASLGYGKSLRERIVSGYDRIEAYEAALAGELRDALLSMPAITLYQAGSSVRKTPTFVFGIKGYTAEELAVWMADEHSIFVGCEMDGEEYYASTLAHVLGVAKHGGWVRLGLAPYNTDEEVEKFLSALKEFLAG